MRGDVREMDEKDFFTLESNFYLIKFILNYAPLAPSTHNTQPWLFEIQGNVCRVYIDKNKTIVYGDPKGRDLFISIGCMLENLVIASRHFGVFQKIEYKFNPAASLVAEI